MLCKILKPFEFSRDGISTVQAYEDTEIDVPDALVRGLFFEGYVGEPDPVEPVHTKDLGDAPENKAVPADIPEDWRELHWQQIRAIAVQFTSDPIQGKDEAVAVIEAELARRAAA